MPRTRRVRPVPVIASQKSEGFSDDEVENTNSSIIEVLRADKVESVHVISSDEEDLVPKRRKLVDESNTISALSKRFASRSSSHLQDAKFDNCWVEKYSPSTSLELAMHPKKLKEIESELTLMLQGMSNSKILLLTGPAGSGKSTAVKILAQELQSDKVNPVVLGGMVIDPTDNDEIYQNDNGVLEYINSITSSVDQFSNFLNECKLLTGPNARVILVEDLPNVFHLETKLRFQKLLRDWLLLPGKLPPLVICVSENEFNDDLTNSEMSYNIDNNFVAETIIGLHLLQNNSLKRIKLNPIAKTYLKKLLSRLVKSEPVLFGKIPKLEVDRKLDNLSMTGDVRSAINCIEFWARHYCHIGDDDDEFLSFGKENSLSLFNAIGKIIYGTSHEDSEVINYKKMQNIDGEELDVGKIDQITINNVLKNYSNKSTFFNLNLLENYSLLNNSNFPICGELDNLIDNLSISDVLNKFNLYEIGSNVAIRSTRYSMRDISNNYSVDSSGKYKHSKLSFSRYYKFLRKYNTTKLDIKQYQFWKFNQLAFSQNRALDDYGPVATSLSLVDAITVDGFYEASILNSLKNETKLRDKLAHLRKVLYVPSSEIPRFPRLGGSFQNTILSDSQYFGEEDYEYFSKNFSNYQSIEEKMMGVVIDGYVGEDAENDESEFDDDDDDPIDDEDEEELKKSIKTPSNEFIDDFNDDDSFQDETW